MEYLRSSHRIGATELSAFNFRGIFLSSSSPRRPVTTILFSVLDVVLYPRLFSCSSKKNCVVSLVIESFVFSLGVGVAPSVVVTTPRMSLSATEIAGPGSATGLSLSNAGYRSTVCCENAKSSKLDVDGATDAFRNVR